MVSKRFVLKRLLLLVPVLFGVATLVFAILHLSPGDPARVIAGQRATDAQVAAVRADLGLDDPLWVQYGRYLVDIVTLNLGESYIIQRGTPILTILRARLPVTLELAIYGQVIGILLGIPFGIISAVKQDTLTDHLTRVGALTGISMPIYWTGPLVILLFAQFLNVLPASNRIASQFDPPVYTGLITVDTFVFGLQSGEFAAFVSAASHMLLPAAVIGVYGMALISRMMRSSMLEVIRQDYMRTARAKGQGAKITVMKHGFQNALIPVITVIGIQFGTLLGGAVLTETVFGIGGIGTMLVQAIEVGDYPVVQGTVLVFAFLFTLVNLGVDLTYSYLDPRIDQ
ncbi:ABC transporter permease [Halogeometricum limi]|uniref:Peptide/nickel transport system permease protein n=1 Tax=Halogeometricum limi TaxID=555875 RepID=A0A1I6ITE5_9EURY|nr:ABC transporter permease [Halogeometricum limi]SFR70017.1 peptide/nickel transport system permease protein [Halogeometricum limi]